MNLHWIGYVKNSHTTILDANSHQLASEIIRFQNEEKFDAVRQLRKLWKRLPEEGMNMACEPDVTPKETEWNKNNKS